MSNMSYCRFRNTDSDYADCAEALEDLLHGDSGKLSSNELRAAQSLVERSLDLVMMLAEHAGVDLDEPCWQDEFLDTVGEMLAKDNSKASDD